MKEDRFKRVSASVLDTFLKALTEYYSTDTLAPGIVTAYLPDRRVYYCSVRRYSITTFGLHNRVIVTASSSISSSHAVKVTMCKWKEEIQRPQQTNLKLFMRQDLGGDFVDNGIF
jgi:hypothetical protein